MENITKVRPGSVNIFRDKKCTAEGEPCKKGFYIVNVTIDENRNINYTLTINNYDNTIIFDIFDDKIEIQPPQKP